SGPLRTPTSPPCAHADCGSRRTTPSLPGRRSPWVAPSTSPSVVDVTRTVGPAHELAAAADDAVIAFHRPHRAAHEGEYLADALASGLTQGDGPYTRRATAALRPLVGDWPALLTTSCTHALEMS